MNAAAEEHNCLVVYPAQTSGANTSKCWNWFSAGDRKRGQGEPSLIAGITREVMEHFHGDRNTIAHPCSGDEVVAQSTLAMPLDRRVEKGRASDGHTYTRSLHADKCGETLLEQWLIHGAANAWSGGSPAGSYTDPRGPDATKEMLRFFLEHPGPADKDAI